MGNIVLKVIIYCFLLNVEYRVRCFFCVFSWGVIKSSGVELKGWVRDLFLVLLVFGRNDLDVLRCNNIIIIIMKVIFI